MNTSQQQNANNGTAKTAAPTPQPAPAANAPKGAGNAATTEPKAPIEKVAPEVAPTDATQKQTTPPSSAKNAVEPPLQAAKGNDEVMSQEQKKS